MRVSVLSHTWFPLFNHKPITLPEAIQLDFQSGRYAGFIAAFALPWVDPISFTLGSVCAVSPVFFAFT
jgi:hypothetical protein